MLLNMSLDEIDKTELVIKRDVKSIKRIMSDGSYKKVKFKKCGDVYTLSLSLKCFDPIALVID